MGGAAAESRLKNRILDSGGRLELSSAELYEVFDLEQGDRSREAIATLLDATGLKFTPPLDQCQPESTITLIAEGVAVPSPADDPRHAAKREATIAELKRAVQWLAEIKALEQKALDEIRTAELKCKLIGVQGPELTPLVPESLRQIPAQSGRGNASVPGKAAVASGGGAGVGAVGFYAESGPDLDGDGHVDGGVFEWLSDLF